MKKILFLMLIMVFFSPLINAYEYNLFKSSYPNYIRIIYDENGNLNIRNYNSSNDTWTTWTTDGYFYFTFGYIGNYVTYISKDTFNSYYRNDLNFLNDLYSKRLNPFLNYLYNKNVFGSDNYIDYLDYELLYNDKGQAVESIVDGVWAGLYSDSQKSKSGALYNKNGSLVYYNGKEVTPVVSFLVWLQKFMNKVVIETFEEMQRSLISGIIAAVVLVLAIVRLVLELLPSSITPRRRRYYGGGRGSLPDYGDGSQVAASVRARLAAKNRALKARAYDRSGVGESTVNGILFDLENDR